MGTTFRLPNLWYRNLHRLFPRNHRTGCAISVNGYLSGPFVRFQKLSFNYELGLGITFNWNKFNPVTNPNNIAISANQSVFIETGLNLEYQISRRYFISTGYGFNHFSNGKLKMPNQGLNTGALKFSLRYQINNPSYSFIKREVPVYDQHSEWDIKFTAVSKISHITAMILILLKNTKAYISRFMELTIHSAGKSAINRKLEQGFPLVTTGL